MQALNMQLLPLGPPQRNARKSPIPEALGLTPLGSEAEGDTDKVLTHITLLMRNTEAIFKGRTSCLSSFISVQNFINYGKRCHPGACLLQRYLVSPLTLMTPFESAVSLMWIK